MKALVTGGAGLIGSHIVDLLLADGHEVRILDSLDAQTHPHGPPAWIPSEAEFVHGDVRDYDAVVRCLRGVDEIYHQAAFGGFTTEVSTYYDANATGTARIFEAIERERVDVRKLVAASSQAIYGEGLYRCPEHGELQPGLRTLEQFRTGRWQPPCPLCGSELAPLRTPETVGWNGETPYAISKLAEERTVIGLGRRLGIPTAALRYAVTFGPRQSVFNPYTGIVSIFSTLLLNGIRPTVYEDGRQTRDFISVRDIAAANVLVMADDRANGEVFNVGRGEPVDVIRLVGAVAAAHRLEPSYDLTGDFRPGDVRHLVHDSAKIRSLGWSPRVALDEGIAEVAGWFRSLGAVGERFTAALEALRGQGVVQRSQVR